MEQYAACAFAHFLNYGIGLEERVEHKVSMPDIGNLFHAALEVFSYKMKEKELTWHDLTEDTRNELGFVIMEEEQKKGYAYECCMAVLKLGKEEYEFERIQALVKEGNKASIHLCEKLGFEFEGKVQDKKEEYLRFLY